MDYEKVGIFLYELRKSRGLTQKDIANRFYITREAVSKWERGLCLPDYPILVALSQFYNITINEILLGQRIDNINKDAIEAVTINIIKTTDKKIKKTKYIATIAVLLVICVMLFMYFIYNYNSIKIYTLTGDNGSYIIKNGELYVSNNKVSLNLGLIATVKNKILTRDDGYKLKLYYNEDNKRIIYEADDLDNIYVNAYAYKDALDDVSLEDFLDNLYVDVINGKEISTIKLDLLLYYANDFKSIFFGNNERFSLKNEEESNTESSSNDEVYIDGEKYGVEQNGFEIKFIGKGNKLLVYSLIDNRLHIFQDEELITYEYENKNCLTDNCDKYTHIIDEIESIITNELGLS